jgi:hypothetical protein
MTRSEKYDKLLIGILSGFLLPFIIASIIFVFTRDGKTIATYLDRISTANIMTHAITLCVFPNVSIFLLFNRYDMLRASRGVLGITIVWAFTVFIVKIL